MSTSGTPLKLRPGLTRAIAESGELYVELNSRVVRLGGGAERLLDLLDGTRSLEDLRRRVRPEQQEMIEALVAQFRRYGFLEPPAIAGTDVAGDRSDAASTIRALEDLGGDGGAALAALGEGRIAILADGPTGEFLGAALKRYGARDVRRVDGLPEAGDCPPEMDGIDLAVAALDGPDPALPRRLNALALSHAWPWLHLATSVFAVRLGPLFLPRETACYVCYLRRLESNQAAYDERRAFSEALRRTPSGRSAPDNLTPGLARWAAELGALEAVRFFAGRVSHLAPGVYDRFVDYRLASHEASPHPVLKLPRCPACGPRAAGHSTIAAWTDPRESDGGD